MCLPQYHQYNSIVTAHTTSAASATTPSGNMTCAISAESASLASFTSYQAHIRQSSLPVYIPQPSSHRSHSTNPNCKPFALITHRRGQSCSCHHTSHSYTVFVERHEAILQVRNSSTGQLGKCTCACLCDLAGVEPHHNAVDLYS